MVLHISVKWSYSWNTTLQTFEKLFSVGHANAELSPRSAALVTRREILRESGVHPLS